MAHLARIRGRVLSWAKSHPTQLRLCLRVTTSAVLTLLVSHLLDLSLALWAILTAVILTQISVGKSLKVTTDYFAGTIGGAMFAGAVGALVPHDNLAGLALVLAITLAPVALLATANVRFSAAPFTAVLVLMAPTVTHLGAISSAFERVIEVAIGGLVSLTVSFVILPAHAYDLTINAAGRMLNVMSYILPKLFSGFTGGLDETVIRTHQDQIGEAYGELDALAAEGANERTAYLMSEPDLGPLLRTLLRLQHDFIMIGRTAASPLPAELETRLGPVLARVSETATDYLRASGAALAARHPPARSQAVKAAFEDYAAQMIALRRQNLTRDLSVDGLEQIFALAFALERFHRNLGDLDRCVGEYQRRGWRFRTTSRTTSGCTRVPGATECHALEHVIPEDQRVHQSGAQMSQERREKQKRQDCVSFAQHSKECRVLRHDR